jgi:hypothetical protein
MDIGDREGREIRGSNLEKIKKIRAIKPKFNRNVAGAVRPLALPTSFADTDYPSNRNCFSPEHIHPTTIGAS